MSLTIPETLVSAGLQQGKLGQLGGPHSACPPTLSGPSIAVGPLDVLREPFVVHHQPSPYNQTMIFSLTAADDQALSPLFPKLRHRAGKPGERGWEAH